jgi:alpha-1,6-mannosyltransferase
MTTLAALGGVLTVLTWADLALHVPGSDAVGSLPRTQVFIAIMAVSGVFYLLAVRKVVREPPRGRTALLLVIVVAAAMRLPLLPPQPFLSSDMYRYVWDGCVQNAGINPYRYIPAAPALSALRDQAIYPHVNRPDYARTIYAPAAEMIFAAVARISHSVLAMKIAMAAFETMGMACILGVLCLAGLPPSRLLIYAWNPLATWCIAENGHVDAIVVGLTGLALLLRAKQVRAATGIAMGAATLTKFLPAAIAPALWRRGDWRMPVAFAATMVLLYQPYSGVGWNVFGFLPGYGKEEGVDTGNGFWLLAGIEDLTRIPHTAVVAYIVVVLALLAGLALWMAFRPRSADAAPDIRRVCSDAAILAACTMAALSPHYPWYFVWLGLPACVAPHRAVVWLSVAPLILYLNPWNEHFAWPCLIYLPAIALATAELWSRRRGAENAGSVARPAALFRGG